MKEYEVIWEIFNKCPRNQKFQGKEVSYDKTVLNDGTIIFDIVTSQIKQRCSFTEI